MSLLDKIFGDPNEKFLKKIQPIVDKINKLEETFERFSNEELKSKTDEFKRQLNSSLGGNKSLDDILPEAFAVVREAAKRTLNQRHYDVQLIGGITLHQGKIAEMRTGEGKTLAATLPLYLNALSDKGAHLITVNDYLARRDTVWMGQVYNFLGLSVGCINHQQAFLYDPEYTEESQNSNSEIQNDNKELDERRDELGSFKVFQQYLRPVSRREAYQADILYGTNNEFGFDYLRDNMVYSLNQMVQARGTTRDLKELQNYTENCHHYAIIDEVDSILIDEARTPLIISAPDAESPKLYEQFAKIVPQLNENSDYTIDEKSHSVALTDGGINKVEKILGVENIYGEAGVRYVHYLEQSLRAHALFKRDKDYVVKEGQVIIVDEFTGRLMPGRRWSDGLHQAVEAKERVRVQQESRTLATITFQNYFRMYKKLSGMTGTALTSAEEFDDVYKLDVIVIPTNKPMVRKDFSDKIYKTEQGKYKAIIEEIKEKNQKGQPILVGTISIEKNEVLGKMLQKEGIRCEVLNAKQHEREGAIIAQAGKPGAVIVATNMAGRGVDIILGGTPKDPEQSQKVCELGGLHVIGTERHDARRIDNQLRGRSGRQGDPGSSQFFVSLEDDLMRRFGSDRIKKMMDAFKLPENQPIENKIISNAIEKAQARIEGINFDIRKHVLEYDDVMNKHRERIYKMRKEILMASDKEIEKRVKELLNNEELEKYKDKEKELGDEIRKLEKQVILNIIDMFWMAHLDTMSHLRESVGLRAYGQKDPLVEYKNEGHQLFKKLLENIDNAIAETLLKAEFQKTPDQREISGRGAERRQGSALNQRTKRKVGRNDPCPCGAKHPDGRPKKYKHCCGK